MLNDGAAPFESGLFKAGPYAFRLRFAAADWFSEPYLSLFLANADASAGNHNPSRIPPFREKKRRNK
ncbi:hypothetical protein DIPPA_14600 [Diplonema papillatum]|nr:hypothetical protein DIPPA_14600 [Diplonema papillatum]